MMTSPAEPENSSSLELAERLRRVIGSFVRLTRAQTKTIKSAQSDTLDILAREGPLSVAALAGLRNVKHQSMRLIVLELEANGSIRKAPNPEDGRSHLVVLTRQGKSAVAKGRRDRAAWIEKAITDNLDSSDIKSLTHTLGAMERLISSFAGHQSRLS